MTNSSPITPPPELVNQWCDEDPGGFEMFDRLATKAARWGADMELEACCEWVGKVAIVQIANNLRAARRPKPPTLKEQALALLEVELSLNVEDLDLLRRALEALPND
jgi:hypothetical protein